MTDKKASTTSVARSLMGKQILADQYVAIVYSPTPLRRASMIFRHVRVRCQRPSNATDRRRRHTVGKQHLLRARDRSIHLVLESSLVWPGPGSPDPERRGAGIHCHAWVRVTQFRPLARADIRKT